MVLMLDILETFLNFHYLTYIRIDENANSEQRQVWRERPRGAVSALCQHPNVQPGLVSCSLNLTPGALACRVPWHCLRVQEKHISLPRKTVSVGAYKVS